jgi:hypothetical protein
MRCLTCGGDMGTAGCTQSWKHPQTLSVDAASEWTAIYRLEARVAALEAALVERKDLHEQIERLRAEAGAYRVVLEEMVRWFWGVLPEDAITAFERVGEEFYAETGMMRPGKSYPLESYPPDDDVRRKTWDEWVKKKRDALEAKARAALSQPAPANYTGVIPNEPCDPECVHCAAWRGK